jgi:hypothetical protein
MYIRIVEDIQQHWARWTDSSIGYISIYIHTVVVGFSKGHLEVFERILNSI